jgi:arabinofuranosyltransferase
VPRVGSPGGPTAARKLSCCVPRRLFTTAVLFLAVATGLAWALTLGYVSDDAFISFRYARNLARGVGLVYNPGERVEGYTNFLWVVVLAGLRRMGADLVVTGRALSLAAGAATVVLAWSLARGGLGRWPALALLAAVLTAVNPYLGAWAGAGLETTLFAALLAASALPLISGAPTRARFLATSGLALLLSLTRPEGVVLYAVLAAGAALVAPGELRARARTLAPGLVLFTGLGAIYFVWRWTYFGDLLPNTFHAKSAFTLLHVERGLAYLGDFATNPFVLCLLPIVAAGCVLAVRLRRVPLVSVPLAVLAIVVAEGGDGLPMYRFLVPAIPFLAALAALGCEQLGERLPPRVGLSLGLTLAAFACALSFFPNRDTQLLNFLYQRDHEVPAWSAAGLALGRAFPPGTTLAAVPIGAVGYYSDLPVIDMVGLTDRTIARTPVAELGSGWAGHEKHNGPYVLSRRPEILLLGNVYVDANPTLPPGVFPPFGVPAIRAREQDVVSAPSFAGDYELRSLQVAPGGFLHYFARRDFAPGR